MSLRVPRVRVTDVAVALAVAVPTSVPFIAWHNVTPLGVLFNAGTVIPLLWRRHAPFAISLTVCTFAILVSVHHRPGQMLQYGGLVAFYTIADLGQKAWQRWAFVVGMVVSTPPAAVFLKHNTASEFMFTLLLPLAAFLLGTLARTARERTAVLAERAVRLEREQEAQAARAAAEERARIARDMHDVLAHAVSLMVVQAEAGPVVVRSDPDRAEQAFDAIAAAGREAMVQLRRTLGVLKEDQDTGVRAPQPTVATLPELVARVDRTDLRVELLNEGLPRPLPPDVDVAAHRIVQEALTNAVKHAEASAVTVRLDWTAEELSITVTDDGRGLVGSAEGGRGAVGPAKGGRGVVGSAESRGGVGSAGGGRGLIGRAGGGHGLIGIRERATSCGGEAEAGPLPGGGFRVTARLPYAERPQEVVS